VEAHRSVYSIDRMCALLDVHRSGYFAWRKRMPSERSLRNAALVEEIKRIYEEGKGDYGSPTVYETLRQEGCQSQADRSFDA
jgi:putative transposase